MPTFASVKLHQAEGRPPVAAVALACGYRQAARCDDLAGFEAALGEALKAEGPAFVHMRIAPGSLEKLGRPTIPPWRDGSGRSSAEAEVAPALLGAR